MVKSFAIGDANNASFYAGILISSFALSEALTSMFWGSLSDRVGRKPVLLLGCVGTMVSMLLVGFAKTFWMALAGRALGGCLNGNIPVIQTMVGELVRNPEHERMSLSQPMLSTFQSNSPNSPSIRRHALCLVDWDHPRPCYRGFLCASCRKLPNPLFANRYFRQVSLPPSQSHLRWHAPHEHFLWLLFHI